MTILPSGEQWELSWGDLRACVVEVGGGLRTFTVGKLDVVDGYPSHEMCHDGRGQILMPWPNRLRGGTYSFDGETYQLPLTEVAHGNAIHGLTRWTEWALVEQSENRVRLTHRLHPMPGYPFLLDLHATYELSDAGLHVTLAAINLGSEACPFGAGQHPYVCLGPGTVARTSLQIPGRSIYRYDDHLIPTERIPVEGTPLDFLELRPIADTVINMDYTDLVRDDDGHARVVLHNPDDDLTLELWMDSAFPHVTVYTGETVQPASRRRQSLAVEPMTCPPNAFTSEEDLVVLEPGDRWEGQWGITVRGVSGHD